MNSDTVTPGDEDRLITWREENSPDYGPRAIGVPLKESHIVQLGSGEHAVDVQMATVGNIGLLRVGIGVEAVGVNVLNPGYIGFVLPVSWSGDYFVNGIPADASSLYMSGELDSFHLRSKKRDTLGVAIPRRPFIDAVAALSGVDVEDVLLKDRELHFHPSEGALVRARLGSITSEATGDGDRRSPWVISNEVLGLMIDAYLRARPESHSQAEWTRRPERIVRQAEERFAAARGEPVSLADLCAAAGVSKSALYMAFHSVCGQPPLAYFQKRRLMQVRSILVNTDPTRGQVKQAALSHGFTELGRFSGDYRELFGELPSVTLNRFTG